MSYGLRVIGDHGLFQIDQDYSNIMPSVRTYHPWATWLPNPPGGAVQLIRPTLPSTMAVISVDINSTGIQLFSSRTDNQLELLETRPAFGFGPSGEAYGLRVYRWDGSLVFDSGHSFVHLIGKFELPLDGTIGQIILPGSVRTRYFLLNDLCMAFHNGQYNLTPTFDYVNNNHLRAWMATPVPASMRPFYSFPVYVFEA